MKFLQYASSDNPVEVARSLTTRFLRDQQVAGGAPSDIGVTRPLPPINNIDDAVSTVFGAMNQQQANQGGSAFDTMDTPAESNYDQRRYDFLSREEAVRSVAYDDATGKPVTSGKTRGNVTVGVGFNMDQPAARNIMSRVLGFGPKQFDAVYTGHKSLDSEQIRRLFDYTANEADQVVNKKLAGVSLNEHQRLALTSMAFNSPSLIGPKITEAIKSGNTKGALDEILYNSNRRKNKGLAKRRWREAAMFAGPAVSGSTRVSALPDFSQYISNFA